MLEYDSFDMSEGIDVNKTSGLLECIIFHYWYFLDINVRFQSKASDGFHDLIKKL